MNYKDEKDNIDAATSPTERKAQRKMEGIVKTKMKILTPLEIR